MYFKIDHDWQLLEHLFQQMINCNAIYKIRDVFTKLYDVNYESRYIISLCTAFSQLFLTCWHGIVSSRGFKGFCYIYVDVNMTTEITNKDVETMEAPETTSRISDEETIFTPAKNIQSYLTYRFIT